jgi:hypothetical protein
VHIVGNSENFLPTILGTRWGRGLSLLPIRKPRHQLACDIVRSRHRARRTEAALRPQAERALVMKRIVDRLELRPMCTLTEAYDDFKAIELELRASEDDRELYDALMVVRNSVKEAMAKRAAELGQSAEWAKAMRGHDLMLSLNPLFLAQDDYQRYIAAYRALTPEQLDELHQSEQRVGVKLATPENIEAELRKNGAYRWGNRIGKLLARLRRH